MKKLYLLNKVLTYLNRLYLRDYGDKKSSDTRCMISVCYILLPTLGSKYVHTNIKHFLSWVTPCGI